MTNPTDAEIIETGIDLADGWRGMSFTYDGDVSTSIEIGDQEISIDDDLSKSPQFFLDALAAQLVRQMDAIEGTYFFSDGNGRAAIHSNTFHLEWAYPRSDGSWMGADGPDRTMNTIRAIVESGVLEGAGE